MIRVADLPWLPPVLPQLKELCRFYKHPVGLHVGWIEVESGGNLREVTPLGERGLYQPSPDEQKALQLNPLKLTGDTTYSILAGFKLIGYYMRWLEALKLPLMRTQELYWLSVKFGFSVGMGAAKRILIDASAASALTDWHTFLSFCISQDAYYFAKFDHSSAKWAKQVDRVQIIGTPYGMVPADPPPLPTIT